MLIEDKNILIQILEKEIATLKEEYHRLLKDVGKFEQLKQIKVKLRVVEEKLNSMHS